MFDQVLAPFNKLHTYTLKNKFDPDYTSLPVGKARQRKMDYLRRLKKGGMNKQQLLEHGRRMNMYGSDVATVLHEED